MKQNVTEYDFLQAFKKLRPDNFSHEGLYALYNYFIEYEESTGIVDTYTKYYQRQKKIERAAEEQALKILLAKLRAKK